VTWTTIISREGCRDLRSGWSLSRPRLRQHDTHLRRLRQGGCPAVRGRAAFHALPATPGRGRLPEDKSDCPPVPTRRAPSLRQALSLRWVHRRRKSLHRSSVQNAPSRPPFCPTIPGRVLKWGQPRNEPAVPAVHQRPAEPHRHSLSGVRGFRRTTDS
jgi:hypothetical protein